ncbi:MAG: hypothetical protein GC206_14010 [Alphaproteobacteria bacterium]|nr:hypothetical protein [Alphaproteobacteria bacterium]
MSTAWIVRGAKIVAILGFFLPWIVVSCQGQTLSSATGIQLVLGESTAAGGAGAQANAADPDIMQQLPFIIALLAIIAGLALSFLRTGRESGQLTLITSGVGLVASVGGFMLLQAFIKGQLNQQSGAATPPGASSDPFGGGGGEDAFAMQMNQMSQNMAQMIQVQPQTGYWLTLVALLVAGAASFMLMQGREQIGGTAAPPPA